MNIKIRAIYILLGAFGIASAQADAEPDFKGLLSAAASHLEGVG